MATQLDELFTPVPGDDEIEGMVQEAGLGQADELELSLVRPEGGVVPVGESSFEITEVTVQRQTPSGFPNIRYQAVCLEGEGENLTVFDNVSMSPRSAFIRNEFLDALGLPREGSIKPKNDLVGLRFRAEVTHEMYNGRLQARFLKYIKADSTPPPADPVPTPQPEPAKLTPRQERLLAAKKALEEAQKAAGDEDLPV